MAHILGNFEFLNFGGVSHKYDNMTPYVGSCNSTSSQWKRSINMPKQWPSEPKTGPWDLVKSLQKAPSFAFEVWVWCLVFLPDQEIPVATPASGLQETLGYLR